MRFAVVSVEGTSLSWWARLMDEGHDVLVYIKPQMQRKVGDGIVHKTENYDTLVAWGIQDKNTVFLFDGSGMGEQADAIRKKGALLVGGGSYCDSLEKDRYRSIRLAKLLGMKAPETHSFTSISDTISWITDRSDRGEATWYFKTDRYIDASCTYGSNSPEGMATYLTMLREKFGDRIKNVLQKKIDGVALSTAGWWNGKQFLYPFEATIEHKKVMTDDLGGATGCAFNAMWFYEEEQPKIVRKLHFDALAGEFRKHDAPPGIYDINSVVSEQDGDPYFLEYTPRFGYDSEPTVQRGLTMPLGEMLYKLASAQLSEMPVERSEALYSVRLTVPPYPFEHIDKLEEKFLPIGVPIHGIDGLYGEGGFFIAYGVQRNLSSGSYEVADPGGIVGLTSTQGTDIEEMNDAVMEFAREELEIPNLGYRTDGAKRIIDDTAALHKVGYDTGPLSKTKRTAHLRGVA